MDHVPPEEPAPPTPLMVMGDGPITVKPVQVTEPVQVTDVVATDLSELSAPKYVSAFCESAGRYKFPESVSMVVEACENTAVDEANSEYPFVVPLSQSAVVVETAFVPKFESWVKGKLPPPDPVIVSAPPRT